MEDLSGGVSLASLSDSNALKASRLFRGDTRKACSSREHSSDTIEVRPTYNVANFDSSEDEQLSSAEIRVVHTYLPFYSFSAGGMSNSDEEAKALAHLDYWDERYSKSDSTGPTHESFRSYSDLKPFLTKHLFGPYAPHQRPEILHLGAGDSVVTWVVGGLNMMPLFSDLWVHLNRQYLGTCWPTDTKIRSA